MSGTSYFIEPDKNIDENVDRETLKFYAEMSPETITDRWKGPDGKKLYEYLRANEFSTDAIKQKIGKLYGKYDLRGINLSNQLLKHKDFSDCDLFRADLSHSDFLRTNFLGAYLSESNVKGTIFDWCSMEDVLLDGVKFNYQTSFKGVNLTEMNFTLAVLLRDHILSQQRIHDLESKHVFLSKLLSITSDYGRSVFRWLISCLAIIIVYSIVYWLGGIIEVNGEINFLNALYYSFTTFATIGFGDGIITTSLGKIIVLSQVVFSYFFAGLLLAILINKIIYI